MSWIWSVFLTVPFLTSMICCAIYLIYSNYLVRFLRWTDFLFAHRKLVTLRYSATFFPMAMAFGFRQIDGKYGKASAKFGWEQTRIFKRTKRPLSMMSFFGNHDCPWYTVINILWTIGYLHVNHSNFYSISNWVTNALSFFPKLIDWSGSRCFKFREA